jgi:REP element-mobilizing transposase RayT
MPQSLARLHLHLIFSTKHREQIISDRIRDSLHAYMATVLQNMGCPTVLINSVEDHVHILFELARTVAVSSAVESVKNFFKMDQNARIGIRWIRMADGVWCICYFRIQRPCRP